MTSGTRSTDNTSTYYSAFMGGNTWDGLKASKTWSGGDTPPGQPKTWHSYNMSCYRWSRSRASWHYYVPNVVNVWKFGPATSQVSFPTHTPPASAETSLLFSKLAGELKGHDFNALVFMGEGKEALSMILEGVQRIAGSLRALRAGNLALVIQRLFPTTATAKHYRHGRRLQSALENKRISVHQAWLELQYGWLPTLSDIYEATKAFYDRSNMPRRQALMVRTTNKGTMSGGGLRLKTWTSARYTRLYAWLTERMSIWDELGLTDPASLFWEKLPFSFVADWLIPIGTYLEARSFASSASGTYAISEKLIYSYVVDPDSLRSDKYYVGGGDESYSYCSISRTSEVAITSSAVRIPGFKPWVKAASLMHCLNAIALIRGLTR